jgi:asparagine synthase (glutamine-hydrolysing)
MCGITGFWTPEGLNLEEARATITAMSDALRHRGPDDAGAWIDPVAGIAFGFRRLAILDLTPSGHQPMESASGRYVIVFNGEIYNHHTLRDELAGLGQRFRGRSDTEVLLAAIETWGLQRTLERCNGMFAFALWDKAERTLSLARDRAGEKPLYYGWMGRTLLFGSELKALRAHPAFQPRIDRNALALYLRRGYVPGPYSIYLGVNKLRAGTSLTVRPDRFAAGVTPTEYWSLRRVADQGSAQPFRGDASEAVEALHDLLTDAVRLRMEADVPLGAFLSGGLDSSTIVALMQAHSTKPVKTFTIGFRDEEHDEARHAAAVARHLGTEHTELYLTPAEALAVIPRLPVLYDEPFADTSQIPTYLLSELTRRHVTVSLSGDAGDELFGGYRRHRLGPAIWRGIRWMPRPLRRGVAAMLAPSRASSDDRTPTLLDRATRRLTGKRSLFERVRQVAEILPASSPVALYHYMMSYWKDPTALLPGAREMLVPATDPAQWPAPGDSPERIMMYLDTVAYLADDILVKLDRASMGTSLEARVPLLDHRVIEFAWSLPLAIRLRGGKGQKWPLRQVLYRYVPASLVNRPKRGFHMPIADWLRGPLRDWAESLLDERHLRDSGQFDPRPIRQKWAEHLSGVTRWDYHLWTVLMFESWMDAAHVPPGERHDRCNNAAVASGP